MRYRVKGEDKNGNLLAIPYDAQGRLLPVPFDAQQTVDAQARHAARGRGGEVERVFGAISWEDIMQLTESLTAINKDGYRLTIEVLEK